MKKKGIYVFVCCIVIIFIGGVLIYNNINVDNNIGTVIFSYSDDTNVVSIDNSLPISDKVGKVLNLKESDNKASNFFEFSVDCNLSMNKSYYYEIYATKKDSINNISDSYIKMYLIDGDTGRAFSFYDKSSVPTFSELKNSSINSNGKVLYTGKCDSNNSKNFILKMWLSDKYTVNFNKKKFSINVYVDSIN